MRKFHHFARMVAVVVLMGVVTRPTLAQDSGIDNTAVARAQRFMDARNQGTLAVSFLHLGQAYKGHSNDGKVYTVQRNGKIVRQEFALKYTYKWGMGGETRMTMFFDKNGAFTDSQVAGTNANFNVPYVLAQSAVVVLSQAAAEGLRDQLTPADQKLLQQLADNADAEGIHKWILRIDSRTSR